MSSYVVRTAEQLPALLKAFRKTAGLTQEQVAASLGVTQQTLSALERNAQRVSAERLLQLLGILGADMVFQLRPSERDSTDRAAQGDAEW